MKTVLCVAGIILAFCGCTTSNEKVETKASQVDTTIKISADTVKADTTVKVVDSVK